MSLGARAKKPSTSTDRNALVDASEHTPMVSRSSMDGSESEGVAQGQPSILPSFGAGSPSVLTAALAPPPRSHRLPAGGGPRRPCLRRSSEAEYEVCACTCGACVLVRHRSVTWKQRWRSPLGVIRLHAVVAHESTAEHRNVLDVIVGVELVRFYMLIVSNTGLPRSSTMLNMRESATSKHASQQ